MYNPAWVLRQDLFVGAYPKLRWAADARSRLDRNEKANTTGMSGAIFILRVAFSQGAARRRLRVVNRSPSKTTRPAPATASANQTVGDGPVRELEALVRVDGSEERAWMVDTARHACTKP